MPGSRSIVSVRLLPVVLRALLFGRRRGGGRARAGRTTSPAPTRPGRRGRPSDIGCSTSSPGRRPSTATGSTSAASAAVEMTTGASRSAAASMHEPRHGDSPGRGHGALQVGDQQHAGAGGEPEHREQPEQRPQRQLGAVDQRDHQAADEAQWQRQGEDQAGQPPAAERGLQQQEGRHDRSRARSPGRGRPRSPRRAPSSSTSAWYSSGKLQPRRAGSRCQRRRRRTLRPLTSATTSSRRDTASRGSPPASRRRGRRRPDPG